MCSLVVIVIFVFFFNDDFTRSLEPETRNLFGFRLHSCDPHVYAVEATVLNRVNRVHFLFVDLEKGRLVQLVDFRVFVLYDGLFLVRDGDEMIVAQELDLLLEGRELNRHEFRDEGAIFAQCVRQKDFIVRIAEYTLKGIYVRLFKGNAVSLITSLRRN